MYVRAWAHGLAGPFLHVCPCIWGMLLQAFRPPDRRVPHNIHFAVVSKVQNAQQNKIIGLSLLLEAEKQLNSSNLTAQIEIYWSGFVANGRSTLIDEGKSQAIHCRFKSDLTLLPSGVAVLGIFVVCCRHWNWQQTLICPAGLKHPRGVLVSWRVVVAMILGLSGRGGS